MSGKTTTTRPEDPSELPKQGKEFLEAFFQQIPHPLYAKNEQGEYVAIDLPETNRAAESGRVENRYQNIVEGLSEMICRLDSHGRTTFRNPAFQDFFGYKSPERQDSFLSLFPEEMMDECRRNLEDLTVSHPKTVCELRNYSSTGMLVWQQWSITSFWANSGTLLGYQAVGTDVTDRRIAQDALAASEARWRSVFEHADDLIMTVNAEGYILSVNDFAGLPANARWAGQRISDVMLEADAQRSMELIERVFNTGTTLKTDYRLRQSSGRDEFYSCTLSPIHHGMRVLTVVVIARNITETKQLEKHTKEALIEGQENERTRVSQELHDGLGQLFTAIKLNLQHLKAGLSPEIDNVLGKRVMALEENISVAISEVKNISRNLMPDVLSQFGLRPAIEDLVKQCDAMSEAQVSLELVDVDQRFSPELEKGIYRMCQELTTNSLKHAGASQIFVQVINHGNAIIVMVEDDGRGFDPEKSRQGFGLKNVRSRAEMLGGTVDMDTRPGKGIVTTIEIPLTHTFNA